MSQIENLSRGPSKCVAFRRYLAFIMCFVLIAVRWCNSAVSMAMVCMVNSTAIIMLSHLADGSMHPINITHYTSDDYGGSLVWTSAEQGYLFSAIFWGSAVIALPGPWLISRFGPKRVVTACLAISLVCSVITPVMAIHGGLWAMFAMRFIMGFGGQIIIEISMSVLITKWIPPIEKGTVMAIYCSGYQIAPIIGSPINAILCKNRNFFGGWPSIFYLSGILVLVVGVIWIIFVDDTAEQSRWATDHEKKHIALALQSQGLGKAHGKKPPWRQLLLSNALWCCVVSMFADGLIDITLLTYVPTYFKEALRLDLKSNGLLSPLPFLSQLLAKPIFAMMDHIMRKYTKISHSVICKIFNSIGFIGTSLFLLACSFMDYNHPALAIFLLCLAMFSFSGSVLGVYTSMICFAPAYTGIVNGIARFSGQISSILAPEIVGFITVKKTAAEWQIVFYVMAAVGTATGLYFLLAGTVEVQPWARQEEEIDAKEGDSSATQQNGTSVF